MDWQDQVVTTEEKEYPNILKTGEYFIMKEVLKSTDLTPLKRVTERLKHIKSRPIYISGERDLGESTIERYKAAGIEKILERAKPLLQKMIGDKWLLLTNKVLLRRTWPISEVEALSLGHNASNLTWHQDSNHKHGSKPMVVMMICLQNGAGLARPGLSILEHPTDQFEGVFGYEGNRVSTFETQIVQRYGKIKIAKPILNAGDLLIFNGLTFHRTFSNDYMKTHRDALLIRIVKPEDAENFPQGNHYIIKTN